MKVLIYAINGLGMGHLNRTLVLARGLRAAAPEVEVQFVVDSPHFGLVADSGFPVTKFPDRRHALGFHRGRELRYPRLPELFDTVFRSWEPDVLVVDFLCKRALFERVKERGIHLAVILRKQPSSSLRQLVLNRGAALVDTWLLPHSAEDWPLSALPRRFRGRAVHLGPVSRVLDADRISAVRESLGDPGDGPLILLTIGGGGWVESQHTLDAVEEALVSSGRRARLQVVYGPNYPLDIPPSSPDGPLRIERRRFIAELPEAMAAADLVICHAGYNSILELRSAGTPALVLPLASPGRDDQEARADALVEEGRALRLSPEAGALEQAIAEVLDDGVLARRSPEVDTDPAIQGRVLLGALGS